MNTHRKLLKIWITISSLIGFVFGWVFLSHTVDTGSVITIGSTTVTMPEFQDIPTINGLNTQSSGIGNVQTFSVNINTSQQSSSPIFRTGGS